MKETIESIKFSKYSLIYDQYNYNSYLLDALAQGIFKFQIKNLKPIRGKNTKIMTDTTYDKDTWDCCIIAKISGCTATFQWRDMDKVRDEYNKWYKGWLYESPDGTIGNHEFFKWEILKWHFHWCKIKIIENE